MLAGRYKPRRRHRGCGWNFRLVLELLAFVGQFGGTDLLDGKLPGKSVGRPLLYVGFDKRMLNFELLFRQFENAILVDPIADLAEEVGDVNRGR